MSLYQNFQEYLDNKMLKTQAPKMILKLDENREC